MLLAPFPMLSGASQGSALGPLLFNIFINDLCAKINFSEFLLFADDLKIFCVIKSAEDCKLLQSDINSVQKWCSNNYMKINIFKASMVSFTSKTNSIIYLGKIRTMDKVRKPNISVCYTPSSEPYSIY
jgi:hypothetical protein